MMMIDMFFYLVFFLKKIEGVGWWGACGLKRSCSHTKKNLVIRYLEGGGGGGGEILDSTLFR